MRRTPHGRCVPSAPRRDPHRRRDVHFRARIREHLILLRREATDEDIEAACRRVQARTFIADAPHGLDTAVGKGGWTLSCRQRQRLAIAPVLLADHGILNFDEATSALASLSERLIQERTDRLHRIFITLGLSTVRTCDPIIVLDQGRIVQEGLSEGWVNQPGLLRDLVLGLSP